MNHLEDYSSLMHPAIERELKKVVTIVKDYNSGDLYDMLTYHMGWSSEGDTPATKGKRIRPLLVEIGGRPYQPQWVSN